MLEASQSQIDIADVLPHELAMSLKQMAEWQNLRPELYLVVLLTTIGSLAKNGTKLVLHRGLDFIVTPNLFGVIVAESSQKKSPVLNTVVKKPLRVLFNDSKNEHKAALEDWKSRKAAAKNHEEFTEAEPQLPIYYFNRATGESILKQAARVPQQGLLALTDEIAGYFKAANQYRKGAGSDSEDLLEYYDGNGGVVLRAAGLQADVDCLNFGLLGTIQPKVLQGFLGKCDDINGKWARFFFIQQSPTASTMPDEHKNFDLSGMLTQQYRKISQYVAQEYSLSSEAFRCFQTCYNMLERERERESNPALRAVIGKTAGRIGKIALDLHLIESANADYLSPPLQISLSTIEKAIEVSKLAINQIRALYGKFDTAQESAPLARIIQLSARKGWVLARDIRQSRGIFDKAKPDEIRRHFQHLSEMGKGEIEGSGTRLRFKAFGKNVGSVENPLNTFNKSSKTSLDQALRLSTGGIVEDVENASQMQKQPIAKVSPDNSKNVENVAGAVNEEKNRTGSPSGNVQAQSLKVGAQVKYTGAALSQICGKRTLTVEAVLEGKATINFPSWCITQTVPITDLQAVKQEGEA